ncbi:MAG: NeuD/PglB/VioB family sugar acetyltransferase [Oscillospiraceae bacterium]|nr:NeuD/PglB/VioB family sugar acetyltransferase [Oscillospiraceae bacterium]
MEDIILVGFGGHAKSIADCIERGRQFNIVGYTDNQESISKYKYLGDDDVLQEYFEKGVRNVVICLGYLGKGDIRERLYNKIKKIGYSFPVIKDPSSIVSDTAVIGEGTFIGKGAIINAEASIGKMCIINTLALVEHECIVDDFVHIAVGSIVCGQVKIGKAAFLGANSTVIQCRTIGQNEIVPAGATIR